MPTLPKGVTADFLFPPANTGDAAGDQYFGGIENLTGSDFDDILGGDDSANLINGGDGSDLIAGRGGNDRLFGGAGNDRLFGGTGADQLFGGIGVDAAEYSFASAAVGVDLETGGFAGEAAGDTYFDIEFVVGSNFSDNLRGDALANQLFGLDGHDSLAGRGGNDSVFGGGGNDTLFGGAGDDRLFGGVGDDQLFGQEGADEMYGEAGSDIYVLDNTGDIADESITGSDGMDTVVSSFSVGLSSANIKGNVENLSLTGTANINGVGNDLNNILTGNSGNNLLFGNGGADLIHGRDGNDTLAGGDGDDALEGGSGADTMDGGSGNDEYHVDNTGDLIIEAAGGGTADRVYASVSYQLAGKAEADILNTSNDAGAEAINLAGNNFAQTIIGNAGNNIINGLGGIDTMHGLGGNDRYHVDNSADAVVETAGPGTDSVLASVSYQLKAGVHVEQLLTANAAGTSAINLTGNEFANLVVGNAGANILNGGGGIDTLRGLGGDDAYHIDNAADVIQETASGGADRALASTSYQLKAGVHVEQLITNSAAGTSAIDLFGNEFANSITGNAGSNIINGKAGADTLRGLGGNDFFIFDTTLGAGNIDTLADFTVAADTIRLENSIFTGLANGVLAASAFHIGATAADASDRIIYNSATGALIFDSNGSAAGGATQFASVSADLAITNGDFFVV
jgi:serralysin